MLSVTVYSVSSTEGKPILNDISLSFDKGKIYSILGKNGSGKSSFVFSLFGHPSYNKTGKVMLDTVDISGFSPDKLSLAGMFLSFQSVPEIPGIKLLEYLRTIYNTHMAVKTPQTKPLSSFIFRRYVEKHCEELHIHSRFLDRDLYVGFSGGEKRKIELLQIRLLDPDYIFLDEIDSGLDIDALEVLSREIVRLKGEQKCIILITHNFHLLDTIPPDEVIILREGRIVKQGSRSLIHEIREKGYEQERE